VDSYGTEECLEMGSSEHGNEPSGSVKVKECFNQLSHYQA
jgi:hypothetical protein